MLRLDDQRWLELKGGYRTVFDPRPFLLRLEHNEQIDGAWEVLWTELHHQGNVGDASYAAVPHLVRIYREHCAIEWNTYAIVVIIELARNREHNPVVPEYLRESYFEAIRELAEIGMADLRHAKDLDQLRAILAVIALSKGLRVHAKYLIYYSEQEMLELGV